MLLSPILAEGFSHASRRPRAVVLDLVWKIIWLGIAGSPIIGIGVWIYWKIGTLEIQAPPGGLENPVALILLGRQLWAQYAGTSPWIVCVFFGVCFVSWNLLEAFFRSRILVAETRDFRLFLASSALKQLLLFAITSLILLIVFGEYLRTPISEWANFEKDSSGALFLTVSIFIALWFVLTLVETTLRSDAVELLGRELFTLIGLVGTLVLFEAMIVGSGIGLGITLMSLVSDATGIWLLLLAIIVMTLALNVLHSYLMVVRYSALDVLRRTSSVPAEPGIIEHVDEFRDDSHPRFWIPVHPTHRAPHS